MDGLSTAASAIAAVSLAVQLVGTVQGISDFLKNVQDAPQEVLRLIETLDQLQLTSINVRQLIDNSCCLVTHGNFSKQFWTLSMAKIHRWRI